MPGGREAPSLLAQDLACLRATSLIDSVRVNTKSAAYLRLDETTAAERTSERFLAGIFLP